MLGIELQCFLFTMQWIPGPWVRLLCVGTTWWQQLCSGSGLSGDGRAAVLPGRLVPLSWRFYGVSDNSLGHLIYKFLKRDFYFPEDWNILSSSHWIIGPRWRWNRAAARTIMLPWEDGHGCQGQALSRPTCQGSQPQPGAGKSLSSEGITIYSCSY